MVTGQRLFNAIFIFVFCPVPVIKKTWEKDALFLEYYSDHADPSIPTTDIGVPNTERGKRLRGGSLWVQLHVNVQVHERFNGRC